MGALDVILRGLKKDDEIIAGQFSLISYTTSESLTKWHGYRRQ